MDGGAGGMSHAAQRRTYARPYATPAVSFQGERRSSVSVEPDYPEWMTWAQRAVFRHVAFHGRLLLPRNPDGCWLWQRCRVAAGYGRVRWDGKVWWTHRLSRFIAFGDAPEAACHSCDNPPCVNPEHLRAGTLSDNTAEMWAKGRGRIGIGSVALGRVSGSDLPAVLRDLASVGYQRGRVARLEEVARRHAISRRTLHRLLSPTQTPAVYRRLLGAAA